MSTVSILPEKVNFPAPNWERAVREFSICFKKLRAPVLAFLLLLFGGNVWACSVPVFRYALEHWPSDAYQVVFFHRGTPTPKQGTYLVQLSPEGKAGKLAANVEVIAVDLDEASPDDPKTKDDLALWKEQNTETLPWMVVRYPLSIPIAKTIWAGEPTDEAIDSLLNSPKRRAIAERLVKGETAVWVFLESGNKEKDDAAFFTLQTELKRAEQELELPAPDPQDVADGLISVDQAALKVQFSIQRVSRTDPNEAVFVNMLLDSEEGLRDTEFDGQPMAFPIFGRGRSLYAVIGAGIQRDVILDACRFLTGPCSCQVKDQNPGVDLLMAVDWENVVTKQIPIDESLPPLPVIAPLKESSESSVPAEKTPAEPATEKEKAAYPEASSTPTDSTVATTTTDISPPEVGSKVMTTTLICFAAALAGIAVLSLFLWKP